MILLMELIQQCLNSIEIKLLNESKEPVNVGKGLRE